MAENTPGSSPENPENIIQFQKNDILRTLLRDYRESAKIKDDKDKLEIYNNISN
jgi:hypothetical protein